MPGPLLALPLLEAQLVHLESEITQTRTQLRATLEASNSHNCTSGAHHERLMVDKSIITELPTADQDVQEVVVRQLEGMNKVFDEWFEKLAADEVAGHCFRLAVNQLGGLEL
ncbi:hypothetical protein B0H14DRAFT_2608934 [Mycena olivaceomarginata]|nr:hypothetical protein B0H14DRAFT_2608934 [Mycena olivaceomarginata]